MAYVEADCSRCGLILPKPELRDWSEEVVKDQTSAVYGTYANGTQKYTAPKTTTTIVRQKLCPDCYIRAKEAQEAAYEAERQELALREQIASTERAQAAARNAQPRRGAGAGVLWGTILLLAAVLIAAVLFNQRHQVTPTTLATPSGPVSDSASTDGAEAPATAAPIPPPAEPANAPATAAPQGEASEDALSTPQNTPALSKAIASALDSGTTTPWQSDGSAGNVTVGPERFYNGKPCRSFSYSTGAKVTGPLYACDGTDGIWRPTADFEVKGLY